jgi:hypothetical protein
VIDKDDIDVKVHRDEDSEAVDSAVLLTHKPTGITVESWEHDTQVANYEAAIAELERRVTMSLAHDVCQEMLDGRTTPYAGAKRIWEITLAAHPIHLPELDTFIYAASEWDERPGDAGIFAEGVMAAAKDLHATWGKT